MSRNVPAVSSSDFQGGKKTRETNPKERTHDGRGEKSDERKQQRREREQTEEENEAD